MKQCVTIKRCSLCCSIDCAGILKLRNSDIELRKGETDVGRKNTRVRLVFRTHLPLAPPLASPGRVLALQVASLPIECCKPLFFISQIDDVHQLSPEVHD